MTTRPWMPLYIADYLADTAHLGALQSGAYLHLIMHYWQHDGLPNNDDARQRIARLTAAEWKRERSTIAAFFTYDWRHKRIDAELAKAATLSDKRRAAAEQRHHRHTSKHDANAHANAMQMDTHARGLSQSPSSEPKGSGAGVPTDEELEIPIRLNRNPDRRALLFGDGLGALSKLTDRPPKELRSVLGRWLKRTGDDADAVIGLIADCEDEPVAEPIAWIEARLKPRDANGNEHRRSTAEIAASAMASALARRTEARMEENTREPDATGGDAAGGQASVARIEARH